MTDEQKAEAAAKQAQAMGTMAVVLSGFSCAFLADRAFGDGTIDFLNPSVPMLAGVAAGVALALIVRVLDRAVGRAKMNPDAAPKTPGVEWAALAMIAVATAVGLLIWQRPALGLLPRTVLQIGTVCVALTAILGFADLRRLLIRNPDRNPNAADAPSPAVLSFAMLLAFWFVFFPLHFVIRRRYGGRNLIVPGLLASAICIVPTLLAWFQPNELPAGDAPEVIATVRALFDGDAEVRDQFGSVEVVRPVEVSFDREAQRRVMKAFVSSRQGEIPFLYELTWQDRAANLFQVRVLDERP